MHEEDQEQHDVEIRSLEQPDVIAEEAGIELRQSRSLSRHNQPALTDPKQPNTKPKPIGPLHPRFIALLMPGSVFGVLARLGLGGLTTYPGASIFTLAWVQVMGCFVMGLCLGIREPLSEFYPELYTALTSGFCGSLTTFSSWQLDMFLAWANRTTPGGYNRIWIYDVMDGLTRLLFTLALSVASVKFGIQVSSGAAPMLQRWFKHLGGTVPRLVILVVSTASVVIYVLTIPMYFILSPAYRGKATAALLFSFPGAFSRYYISLKLNPLRKTLPLGTLTVNTLGTLLLCVFYVSERTRGGTLSLTSCVMLKGLADGYCGCLSTISTFASELTTLPKWKAWRYAVLSVLLGQIITVVVIGGAEWGGGVRDIPTCSLKP
ncbi:hypothetical protein FRB94_001327 [Tulasnella sp. JGI-2019a]|nr:hypothetical protein FRB94_001327 [Tulasnella sp. JGI-2019a]